ncbi:MAG: PEGA domain-containing protein [Myxococcota bacterium]
MPQQGAPVVVAPPVVVEPQKVTIKLDSSPTGADVFDGETLLGKTPLAFSREKDSGTLKLSVQLKGYQPYPITLGTVADIETTATLKKGSSGTHSGGSKPLTGGQGGTMGGTF